MNDSVVQLIDVYTIKDITIHERKRHIGKVIFIENNVPIVICKKGLLALVEIKSQKNKILNINFRTRFH